MMFVFFVDFLFVAILFEKVLSYNLCFVVRNLAKMSDIQETVVQLVQVEHLPSTNGRRYYIEEGTDAEFLILRTSYIKQSLRIFFYAFISVKFWYLGCWSGFHDTLPAVTSQRRKVFNIFPQIFL